MKIIADIDIPYIQDYFAGVGELILKPGRLIEKADVRDADLLLVRSVTPVNEKLLAGSPVKFVGTVTTGIDHLDTAWLDKAGILWQAAAGYNALPVADYVIAVIAALQDQKRLPSSLSAGVVGVGRVGGLVAERLEHLGFEVFLCDPPRADQEANFISTPLSEMRHLDFISLHTPLERGGKYPSYHLIDASFLRDMTPAGILLNTGRGEVIDFSSLPTLAGEYGFDVWENEPNIDLSVLQKALIATPHLAGYSIQCRYRGIDMIYRALLDLQLLKAVKKLLPPIPKNHLRFGDRQVTWQEVVLTIFNPLKATAVMKEALSPENVILKGSGKCATLFDALRQEYIGEAIKRHEFAATTISQVRLLARDHWILKQLGITIEE